MGHRKLDPSIFAAPHIIQTLLDPEIQGNIPVVFGRLLTLSRRCHVLTIAWEVCTDHTLNHHDQAVLSYVGPSYQKQETTVKMGTDQQTEADFQRLLRQEVVPSAPRTLCTCNLLMSQNEITFTQ